MYETLAPADEAVAVRSSALGEDGTTHSYAGQYDTLLNLSGRTAVIEAVRRCRESASNARLAAYQETHGLSPADSVAVIVQKLVRADAAFVAFTRDPVNPLLDDAVVSATWGLGEPLVGGTVDPDTFRIRRAPLALSDQRLGQKAEMAVPVAGGVRMVAVPRFLRARPALTVNQVNAIAKAALSLEHELGYPVDIEGAVSGDQWFLLQCRPITRHGEARPLNTGRDPYS